jgi:hypothetical protein
MALTRCRECGKKISTEAAACPNCGAPPPLKGDPQPKAPRTRRWRVLLTVFGILVLLWFIGLIARAPHLPTKDALPAATSMPPREQAKPKPSKEEVLRQVKLNFSWSTGGFDNVMLADFVIKNPTPHRFKDIQITCMHYAPSGTLVDSNVRTIYVIVPPNGSKSISRFNMGLIHSQARSSSCSITNVVVE